MKKLFYRSFLLSVLSATVIAGAGIASAQGASAQGQGYAGIHEHFDGGGRQNDCVNVFYGTSGADTFGGSHNFDKCDEQVWTYAGDDSITAGLGINTIDAGTGADKIQISSGQTTLVYDSVSDSVLQSHDIVTGFKLSVDKLDISNVCRLGKITCQMGSAGNCNLSRNIGDISVCVFYAGNGINQWQTYFTINMTGTPADDFIVWFNGQLYLTSGNFITGN